MMRIGIFGTGAYGMALSSVLTNNGCDVTMWTKFPEEKELLEKNRGNENYIPNFKLADSIKITNDVGECIKDKDLLIIVIPAAFVRDLCIDMKPYIDNNNILIATKGIEQETGLFVDEIVSSILNTTNIGVISGPSFAIDLVSGKVEGLSLASESSELIKISKKALENNYVRLRETTDVKGVEICGSIKNVVAIASGIFEGLEANDSTKAMLIVESIHDIEEILEAFGCDRKTVLSYAGIGDILLTCTSTKSRNFTFGKIIGEKKSREEIDKYIKETTIEGYYTLESIYKLLRDKKVKIPLINLIHDIIVKGSDPELLFSFLISKS